MGVWEAAAVLLAGAAAGTINTVVGTGSLVSFPTLLALGVPPVVANASNTTGLVPGGLSGTLGYRREPAAHLRRQRGEQLDGYRLPCCVPWSWPWDCSSPPA